MLSPAWMPPTHRPTLFPSGLCRRALPLVPLCTSLHHTAYTPLHTCPLHLCATLPPMSEDTNGPAAPDDTTRSAGQEASSDTLSLREATEYAGRSADTLRRAIRQGKLPRQYTPGTYGPELVIPRAALDNWLADQARRVESMPGEAVPSSETLVSTPAQDFPRILEHLAQRLTDLEALTQEQAGQLAAALARIGELEVQRTASQAAELEAAREHALLPPAATPEQGPAPDQSSEPSKVLPPAQRGTAGRFLAWVFSRH